MMRHAALSSPAPARHSNLLHRCLGAARQPNAGEAGRGFARCGEGDAGGTALWDRRVGGLAGSPALHLALAQGGLRLQRPVGRDQSAVLSDGEGNGGVEPHPYGRRPRWRRGMQVSGSGGSTSIISAMKKITRRICSIVGSIR